MSTTGADDSAAEPGGDTRIPVAELDYEQARDELADVVSALEHGGLGLDASLALWERGEALATRCTEHLEGARERIEAALNADDEDDGDDEG